MSRDITLDIMKGVAILAVIAGHVFSLDSIEHRFIYSFHMPLFFIVAGYLYKPNTGYRKKLAADARRLLKPYLFIAVGFMIYLLLKEPNKVYALKYSLIATIFGSACNHSSLYWSTAPRIGAAWFLPALFWCRQIFNFIFTRIKHPDIVVIVLAMAATLTDAYLVNLPFALLPGISAMMFYLIGHRTGNMPTNKTNKTLLFTLGAVCWLCHIRFSVLSMCTCHYGIYPIDIIGASFATAIIYYLSKWASAHSFGNILAKIGEVSLYIYCFHVLEAEVKPYEWLPLPGGGYMEFIVRTFWCLAVAFAFLTIKDYVSSRILKGQG